LRFLLINTYFSFIYICIHLNSIASNKLCIIGIDVYLNVLLHLGHFAGETLSTDIFSSYQSYSTLSRSLLDESLSIESDAVTEFDRLLYSSGISLLMSIADL